MGRHKPYDLRRLAPSSYPAVCPFCQAKLDGRRVLWCEVRYGAECRHKSRLSHTFLVCEACQGQIMPAVVRAQT